MTIIEIRKLRKEIGDRVLFDISNFSVAKGDRIGIVGKNGAGKTTLLNILAGYDKEYSGDIRMQTGYCYVEQLSEPLSDNVDTLTIKKANINNEDISTMSGGEKTKLKIQEAIYSQEELIMLDEPTSNLDINNIEQLEKFLINSKKTILLISHDKTLLDKICTKIIELDKSKLTVYKGNYSSYLEQKKKKLSMEWEEYETYIDEKAKLTEAIKKISDKSRTMKAPKRMGNSEARLMKGAISERRKQIDKSADAMKGRLERLEKVDKPYEDKQVKILIPKGLRLASKNAITIRKVKKAFGDDKQLFEAEKIYIEAGKRTAIIGDNGSGKTTLLNMIKEKEDGIEFAGNAKPVYFSQGLDILEENKSIIENVMSTSCQQETIARIVLGRLMFRENAVHKPVAVLSGGERVRVCLAKVLLSEMNILILDEPTNYLDIESRKALIDVLKGYDGTVLFVTHDRNMLEELADSIIEIKNKKISKYNYSYKELLQARNKPLNKTKEGVNKLQLEIRLSSLLGQINKESNAEKKAELNEEYTRIYKEYLSK